MKILARTITIDNGPIDFVRLGEISEIKEGLGTADNKSYLYKKPDALGSYRIIDEKLLLKKLELDKIITNDKLRLSIIENGIPPKMFEGRTVIPYDKGGSSDIEAGRLSNYYFPTQFYIDWSTNMVQRMKTLTIAERKRLDGKGTIRDKDEYTLAAVFRNTNFYFKPGLTVPMAGIYSPTFKINSSSVFDHGGNCIFLKKPFKNIFSYEFLLGILGSKLTRYLLKNFINNSVNTPPDVFKPLPIPIVKNKFKKNIESFINKIIQKQKKDLNYEYQKNEQIDIDNLVFKIFDLNEKSILEIETWFKRRYPKLF